MMLLLCYYRHLNKSSIIGVQNRVYRMCQAAPDGKDKVAEERAWRRELRKRKRQGGWDTLKEFKMSEE